MGAIGYSVQTIALNPVIPAVALLGQDVTPPQKSARGFSTATAAPLRASLPRAAGSGRVIMAERAQHLVRPLLARSALRSKARPSQQEWVRGVARPEPVLRRRGGGK